MAQAGRLPQRARDNGDLTSHRRGILSGGEVPREEESQMDSAGRLREKHLVFRFADYARQNQPHGDLRRMTHQFERSNRVETALHRRVDEDSAQTGEEVVLFSVDNVHTRKESLRERRN